MMHTFSLDERRKITIAATAQETILFGVEQFLTIGSQAIAHHGHFHVALSGGNTPKAIFKELSLAKYQERINWSKICLYWGDERSVGPQDADSNYYSAMESGLSSLPFLKENIHRMHAEDNIEENAEVYEQLIREKVPHGKFDLIMLGMGDDGHTASLFPRTHGLHVKNRLVVANEVPQKNTWRMTFTFECIHHASHVQIYVIGASKAEIVAQVLLSPYNPDNYPIQKVGTQTHPAQWILDQEAAKELCARCGQ